MHQLKNLIILFGIQAGNAIFPLALFPFLLSEIGSNTFAAIATTEAVALAILTIALYGFDVTGIIRITKEDASSKNAITRIYYEILYSRLLIFFITSAASGITLLFIAPQHLHFFLLWLMYPVGMILQSNYFFQAKENNFPVAAIVILARTISAIAIFVQVANNQEPIWILLTLTSSFLASGLLLYAYAVTRHGMRPITIPTVEIINSIRDSRHQFFSSASVLLYRGSNIIILSILSVDPSEIGIYTIAEKYTKNIQAITLPLSQHYSIKLTQRLQQNRNAPLKAIGDVLRPQMLFAAIVLILCACSAAFMWSYLSDRIQDILILMIFMMPAILFGVANFMIGTIALNTLGAEGDFSRTIFAIGLGSIISSFFLSTTLLVSGAAIVYGFSEVALTTALLMVSMRKFKR